MAIKFATRDVNDVVILDASGRITLGDDATRFREAVQDLLAKGHKKIVLNFAEVTYVDSSGIGELISMSTSVAKQGGKVKLLNVAKRVHELLQITKTIALFDLQTDEATAVASFT